MSNTQTAPQRMQDKINEAVLKAMQQPENFIAAFLHQNPSAKIEEFTLCQQTTHDGIKFWLEPRAAAKQPHAVDAECPSSNALPARYALLEEYYQARKAYKEHEIGDGKGTLNQHVARCERAYEALAAAPKTGEV